ncbi:hypothetical protein PACTADRAFT_47726 [Pachysolen tannophilus NRRL Y-2460]|uniref:Uncharacterized protein n=1 Tax=Pachysolen tannophilus NRRL Y-2460 TaxID=669874 RepID=A0A1E4U1M6_PACTA|nr:hypothetical protein PACTADRAFT_47726 [Pachysolen tannophilus NRRL Y-2460]
MCNIHPLLVELNNLSNNESEIQDLVIRSLQSLSFNSYKKIIDKVDFNQNEKLYNTLEIFTFYNDIYDGIKKLKILKQDQVFAKSPIMENLIRFKKIKLAKAIKNLEVNTDEEVVVAPDMNELIKKLIKRNLNEINSLVDYEGKFNQCEEAVNDKAESISKSRKRKVGE